jgi:hypothetical protein
LSDNIEIITRFEHAFRAAGEACIRMPMTDHQA